MSQPEKNNHLQVEIHITTALKTYCFRPVPMSRLAKGTRDLWVLFTKGYRGIEGYITLEEKNRLEDFMRQHKTDAVTEDGMRFFTTTGANCLHGCNPFLPDFAIAPQVCFVALLKPIFDEKFDHEGQIYSF